MSVHDPSGDHVNDRAQHPDRAERLAQHRVMLHARDADAIEMTVHTLVDRTPLELGEAVDVTIDAQNRSKAVILETHLERAEFYREQLAFGGLRVTLEPAPV